MAYLERSGGKLLRECGVDEVTIEQIRIADRADFNSNRRFYRWTNDVAEYLEDIQQYGFALFFRQSTDCFKKQLWRDFLPGFLKDGFGGFTFEIFIKRMKLPRFV